MGNAILTIPRGDGRVVPFRVLLDDGSYLDLTDYSVALVVKRSPTDAEPLHGPFAGVLRSDTTYSDITIPEGALAAAGRYPAAITADGPGTADRKTMPLTLIVEEHAG